MAAREAQPLVEREGESKRKRHHASSTTSRRHHRQHRHHRRTHRRTTTVDDDKRDAKTIELAPSSVGVVATVDDEATAFSDGELSESNNDDDDSYDMSDNDDDDDGSEFVDENGYVNGIPPVPESALMAADDEPTRGAVFLAADDEPLPLRRVFAQVDKLAYLETQAEQRAAFLAERRKVSRGRRHSDAC